MPKSNLERNTFVKGLITEATPLTFPENASIDEDNFVLNRDGSRQRRLGMDYENNNTTTTLSELPTESEVDRTSSFTWKNAGYTGIDIFVMAVKGRFVFFELKSPVTYLADVTTGVAIPLEFASDGVSFAAVEDKLITTTSYGGVNKWTFTSPNTFTYEAVDVQVRDQWGVEDGLEVSERPSTLTDLHNYNLLNQGWTPSNILNFGSEDQTVVVSPGPPPVVDTIQVVTGYPSNSDVMQYGKDATDTFDKEFIKKQFFGNSPAVRGRFIIDYVGDRGAQREASALSELEETVTLPEDLAVARSSFTSVASFAGRVFYGTATGDVLFSQIILDDKTYGRCYQEADPTSEHISDLLPTDGGLVKILGAGPVLALVASGASLLVFTALGVWEISGPDGVFAADDYNVRQITTAGIIGKETAVAAEDSVFYWSKGGIYLLQRDQVSGYMSASNLTESTIQDYYLEINTAARDYATGVYDSSQKKVRWLYSSSFDGSANNIYPKSYDKELVFDLILQAFYPQTIYSVGGNYVCGYTEAPEFIPTTDEQNVVDSGILVTDSGDPVVVSVDIATGNNSLSSIVYPTIRATSDTTITFSVYNNTNFKDWETFNATGVDAPAYLVTGYELFADSQRNKYIPYLTVHMKFTGTGFTDIDGNLFPVGDSGCRVQPQWDFADSANSGKWGNSFQAYRLKRPYMPSGVGDTFDYGHAVISTKNKLRGSGKALSLKFNTEEGKDCQLYGWAMTVEGGGSV